MDNYVDSSIVHEYPNGIVKRFVSENGQTFEAYIPNNYSKNTSVVMYEHGDTGYFNDWQSYTEKFLTGSCDSIVIRAKRNNSVDLYNSIVNQYGLETSRNINVSFSGGTVYSLKETAQMINENPSALPPVSVILDGYTPVPYLKSQGVVDTLANSNAIVLAFGRPGGEYYSYSCKELAEEGVNVVVFKDKSAYGNSHSSVNRSYMEGGLYEYSLGIGELPDRYEISVYDSVTGSFVTLDHSQVSNIGKVYEYFGIDDYSVEAIESTVPETSFFTNLSNSFLSLFEEKPLDLKYSNYKGFELSVKPKSVEYVMGYLSNTVVDDLEAQMDSVRAVHAANLAYAAEDPAVPYSLDLGAAEGMLSEAVSGCKNAAASINEVMNAIIKYGNGEWNEGVSSTLNSFLGIKDTVTSGGSQPYYGLGDNDNSTASSGEEILLNNDSVVNEENFAEVSSTGSDDYFVSSADGAGKIDRFSFLNLFDSVDNDLVQSNESLENNDISNDLSVGNSSFSNTEQLIVPESLTSVSNTKIDAIDGLKIALPLGTLAIGKIGYDIIKNKEDDEEENDNCN